MKKLFLMSLFASFVFSFTVFSFTNLANAKPVSDEYVRTFESPEIIFHNEHALKMRLKLLQEAPAGSEFKILTFVFENGESTRMLATKMCEASKRGVRIQFMTDSKSGSDPKAKISVFKNQTNEDIYQYLANCGVSVRIYNYISKVEMGAWVAKVAGQVAWDAFKSKISGIASIFGGGDDEEEEEKERLKEDIKVSITGMWEAFKAGDKTGIANQAFNGVKAALILGKRYEVDDLQFVKDIPNSPLNRLNHRKLFWVRYPESTRRPLRNSCMVLGGRNLGDHYLSWHVDSFLDSDIFICRHMADQHDEDVTAKAAESFDQLWNDRPEITFDVQADQNFEFSKIWFENEAQASSYTGSGLLLSEDNPKRVFADVSRRDQAWANRILGFVKKRHHTLADEAAFHRVEKASSAGKRRQKIFEAAIEKADSMIPTAENIDDNIRGFTLGYAHNWNLLRSGWRGKDDEIRTDLYRSIDNEMELVYIETAYSQFDNAMKEKLEAALERGVKVMVRTNGLYTSDGVSWFIRLLMARWVREMHDKYGANGSVAQGLFEYEATTLHFNHMIHFKGAGFKCQGEVDGLGYKKFFIGSHNFHPRSGLSDKEHALVWKEAPSPECLAKLGQNIDSRDDADVIRERYLSDRDNPRSDLIDYRNRYYSNINAILSRALVEALGIEDHYPSAAARRADLKLMKPYVSLHDEIKDVMDKSGPLHAHLIENLHSRGPIGYFVEMMSNWLLEEEFVIGPDGQPRIRAELEGDLDMIRDMTLLIEFIM